MDLAAAQSAYQALVAQRLNLDITRGKPSADQTALSESLDGILKGEFSLDGTDLRNYGGLDGLPSAKALGANLLDTTADRVIVGGNSSLSLMHLVVTTAYLFGLNGADSAWRKLDKIAFICPVPGYDRHFSICEQFGIDMLTVPMTENGPCMDSVEALLREHDHIRGMWCVPKYSNPTGATYSDETVDRIAQLGNIASDDFVVLWDNAYGVHHLSTDQDQLKSISAATAAANTEDSVIEFASTSKITLAGAGVAFMAASDRNLKAIKSNLGFSTIGPDKVNQARHVKFLPDTPAIEAHMAKHAAQLAPKFAMVLSKLADAFNGTDMGTWESPKGGYFVSFDTQQGLAKRVVQLAADAGVKLTPAGATFPYGSDPNNSNIRIAPSFPSLDELDTAMDVFVACVQLATLEASA